MTVVLKLPINSIARLTMTAVTPVAIPINKQTNQR